MRGSAGTAGIGCIVGDGEKAQRLIGSRDTSHRFDGLLDDLTSPPYTKRYNMVRGLKWSFANT